MAKRYSPLPTSDSHLYRELLDISISMNDLVEEVSVSTMSIIDISGDIDPTFISSEVEFQNRRTNFVLNVSINNITLVGCKSSVGDDPTLVPYAYARIIEHETDLIAVGDLQ